MGTTIPTLLLSLEKQTFNYSTMKKLLPLLFIIVVLYGCVDCGPQQELTVGINFHREKDSLHLNQVYALGALDQQIFNKQTEDFNNSRLFLTLAFPISLLTDSTTYVFEFENRTDTLTLFYQRDFYYKKDCGFVVDTKKPARSEDSKSTFSKVNVSYDSYLMEKVTFTGGTGGNGINVDVTL